MKNKQMPSTGEIIGVGVVRNGMPCGVDITRVTSMKVNDKGMKFSFKMPMPLLRGDTLEVIFQFVQEQNKCSS